MADLNPSFPLSTIDLNIQQALIDPDAPNKGLIVSVGGTNAVAGTVSKLDTEADFASLANGSTIASAVHNLKTVTEQTFKSLPIDTFATVQKTISTLTWSAGVATITATAHLLPAGFIGFVYINAVGYEGVQYVTRTGIDTLTFETADFGDLAAGSIEYGKGTYTGAYELPVGRNYMLTIAGVKGDASANYNQVNDHVFSDDVGTNTFYTASRYTATAAVLTGSPAIRALVCVRTGHNLDYASNLMSYVNTTSAGATQYTGYRFVTATTASAFIMGTGTATGAPAKNIQISYIKLTTNVALAEALQTLFNATISDSGTPQFNGTKAWLPYTTTTFTAPLNVTSQQPSSSTGQILDTDSTILQLKIAAFFKESQKSGGYPLPVYVLELGADTIANEILAFGTWLSTNSNYRNYWNYLLPETWGDSYANLLPVAQAWSGDDYPVWFIAEMAIATKPNYNGLKAVLPFCNDPAVDKTAENATGMLLFDACNRFLVDGRFNQPLHAAPLNAASGELTPYSLTDFDATVALVNQSQVTIVANTPRGNPAAYRWEGVLTCDSTLLRQLPNGNVAPVAIELSEWLGLYYTAKIAVQRAIDNRIIAGASGSLPKLLMSNSSEYRAATRDLAAIIDGTISAMAAKGCCQPTTVSVMDFSAFKAAYPLDWAAGYLGNAFVLEFKTTHIVKKFPLTANVSLT